MGSNRQGTQDRAHAPLLRLAPSQRLIAAATAVGIGLLYILAAWLEPDPRGLGTHEQLGFPPCLTVRLFGVPCPFCGMTTAFSLMAHGHPMMAFWAQPAGVLLFFLCGVVFVGAAVAAVTGRWSSRAPMPRMVAWTLRGTAIFVTLAWIYKIAEHFTR